MKEIFQKKKKKCLGATSVFQFFFFIIIIPSDKHQPKWKRKKKNMTKNFGLFFSGVDKKKTRIRRKKISLGVFDFVFFVFCFTVGKKKKYTEEQEKLQEYKKNFL